MHAAIVPVLTANAEIVGCRAAGMIVEHASMDAHHVL
jgi:hypothetical protein